MREIKFRAWFENEMLDNEKLIYMDQETHAMYTIVTNEKREDGVVFMQYTGLKDKNGREIYEGDVIYWEIDNGVGIEKYSAVVCWSENTEFNDTYKWLVKYSTDHLRGGFDELSFPAAYNNDLNIIGNIYENPELLEVNK